MRDDGHDAAFARRLPVGLAGVALVADGGARIDIGPKVEQNGEVRRVRLLAAGQIESEIASVEIGLQVDLGGKSAARAAKRLIFFPPFAPAAETWARTTVESNICTRCADEESEAR